MRATRRPRATPSGSGRRWRPRSGSRSRPAGSFHRLFTGLLPHPATGGPPDAIAMTGMDEQLTPTETVPLTEAPTAPRPRPAKKTAAKARSVSRRTVVLAAGAAARGLPVSRVLRLHNLRPDPLALVNPTAA